MSWLHRLQQRLSITNNEAITLLSLTFFLLLGSAGRFICGQMAPVPADFYAESDSVFAERSAALLDPLEDVQSHDSAGGAEGPSASGADSASALGNGVAPRAASSPPVSMPAARPPAETPPIAASGAQPLRIDLNRADVEELQRLPRVGRKTAERIIAFREAYGAFHSVEELVSVKGIGPKTLENLRPHVYVASDSSR